MRFKQTYEIAIRLEYRSLVPRIKMNEMCCCLSELYNLKILLCWRKWSRPRYCWRETKNGYLSWDQNCLRTVFAKPMSRQILIKETENGSWLRLDKYQRDNNVLLELQKTYYYPITDGQTDRPTQNLNLKYLISILWFKHIETIYIWSLWFSDIINKPQIWWKIKHLWWHPI